MSVLHCSVDKMHRTLKVIVPKSCVSAGIRVMTQTGCQGQGREIVQKPINNPVKIKTSENICMCELRNIEVYYLKCF